MNSVSRMTGDENFVILHTEMTVLISSVEFAWFSSVFVSIPDIGLSMVSADV